MSQPKTKTPTPNSQQRQPEPLLIRAAFTPSSVNAEGRTVELVWTTGAEVRRYDWRNGGHYWERLKVDEKSIDLSRLRNGAPLLAQHNQYSLNGQIGVVESVRVADGKGYAVVRFSRRDDVEPIWQDVRDGIIRNVSVGYDQNKLRDTNEERDGIPVREVTRWTPHELSLVSIPADAGAQVREAPTTEDTEDTPPMGTKADTPPARDAATNPPPAPATAPPAAVADDAAMRAAAAQAAQEAVRGERERVDAIHHAVDAARLSDGATLARTLVSEGVTADVARQRVLERLAERDAPETSPGVVQPGDGRRDEKFRALAVEGLAYAAEGTRTAPESHEAQQIAAGGLHEFMRSFLEMNGRSTRGLAKGTLVRAAMETGDFVHIIADVAEKSLLAGNGEEKRKFTTVFRPARARNFKNIERVRLSDYPELLVVSEGDTYVEAALGENKESYTVLKHGRRIGYTWEMMINEDLDMIGRIPMLMGAAAARKENDVVWGKLVTPGNLADGDPVFNVADENESDLALDAAGLKIARKYFHTRTAENGQKLELDPAFLVVGPDLIDQAEFLLGMYPENAFPDRTQSVSSELRRQLTLVMCSRVTGDNWFMLGSTNQIDTIEYAYLDGHERPTITRENSFDVDKIDLKIRHIVGAGWVDRRGAWHSDSTA